MIDNLSIYRQPGRSLHRWWRATSTNCGGSIANSTFDLNRAINEPKSLGEGGGLYLINSTTIMSDCTFTGNTALREGGGLFHKSTGKIPFVLSDCTFNENESGNGAAARIDATADATVVNCVFADNKPNGYGYPHTTLSVSSNSTCVLDSCAFDGNSQDGYIHLTGSVYGDFVLVENCQYTSNNGGLAVGCSSNATVTGCTFSNNEGYAVASGVHAYGTGPVHVTQSEFTGNTYWTVMCQSLPLDISECVFSNHEHSLFLEFETSDSAIITYHDNAFCENLGGIGDGEDLGNCVVNSCADSNADGWPDACAEQVDLQYLLEDAIEGDTIQLEAGVFSINRTLDPLGKAITIRGQVDSEGNPTTTVDGQGVLQVLQCTSQEGDETIFENLIITGGLAERGGGLYCYNSDPTVTNCVFLDNTATKDGGGMCLGLSRPTVTNCVFQQNSASDRGGGMYYDSYDSYGPVLDTCVFKDNSAASGGGGLYLASGGVRIGGSVFCNNFNEHIIGSYTDLGANCLLNTCQDGNGDGLPDCDGTSSDLELDVPGEYSSIGLAIDAAAPGAVITVAGGTYTPATVLELQGKALTLRGAIDENGVPTTIIDAQGLQRVFRCVSGEGPDTVLENLVITGGHAERGGGMYCTDSSSPTLVNCVFQQNSASSGGGMYCSDNSSPALLGCEFRENSASYRGGGIRSYSSNLMLSNTILCGNIPDQIDGGFVDIGGSCAASSCTDADEDGTPDNCGDIPPYTLNVPTDNFPTIYSAITAAENGAVIEIAAGTYRPLRRMNPEGKQITIRGATDKDGRPSTVIEASYIGVVAECRSGEDEYTVFENLLFTRDRSSTYGGGMYCYNSSPTLRNCVFQENSSAHKGGGMHITSKSNPTLENCVFRQNSALEQGGGVHCGLSSNPTLTNCVFEDNTASSDGGGLSCDASSNPTLTNCVFQDNTAFRNGGGLSCDAFSNPTLDNCLFQGNQASSSFGSGGGVFCQESSPTLTNCVFKENQATGFYGQGGGMYCASNSSPTLEECVFQENSAMYGGGMYSDLDSSPALSNTILCGNTPDQAEGPFTDNGGNCIEDVCIDCEPTDCPSDLNGDGITNGVGPRPVLRGVGSCALCPEDFNADGEVNSEDLGLLFVAWGPCN